ncbi:MAG: hypothetical protein M3178_17520 [Pseudomonadota bacterium]|nr:hypothetical protein [Pseudomonadota bacterium]
MRRSTRRRLAVCPWARHIVPDGDADKSYMDEGVQILERARNAQCLFERKEPRQKRGLLNFVLSNCTWEDGEVVATFRQPFDFVSGNHRHRIPPWGGKHGQLV